MAAKPTKTIEEIVAADGRYAPEAVQFVREGLTHTIDKHHPEGGKAAPRHVSGAELCEGLRLLALKRWGPLAPQVLRKWRITRTRDFGEIVFLLVNNSWLQKEPQDCIKDFDDVYDFDDAFRLE